MVFNTIIINDDESKNVWMKKLVIDRKNIQDENVLIWMMKSMRECVDGQRLYDSTRDSKEHRLSATVCE